ncbi:dolichyl-diphosphooligosaccharide-protein glycotransferase [Aspergillus brunneoviolaceus CBS 621.78]|uniref:Dolichyl-diphosphooligosaccharide-protein glycosyltransferase 48kDa subunit n=1 Tax=Aspergillus brunneoviolaceus CBS 621.78 TaxID=1450534 RepID=A0ACD1GF11_9EURO|nr:Dolichyl-diphosphooligosaccharide-protein glycosyltransferase 48kDa subunit [Aspergillus brunneoviolaceus CBS 621.78]RAH47846.1 Dolichyl-diphosphooligosaccharide-protein glycosyltransferase 48kDa subunit [Aspergillus brunneoviolaceus CBS 621.78]
MRWCLSFFLFGFLAVVNALSSSGNRLLVVLEDASEKGLYSTLWSDLKARGYDIAFESPKSDQLSLFELGERAYDHLLLLPPKSKGFGPSLSPKNIVDFLNKDGNVLLALSGKSTTPSAISSLLLELDLHLSTDRSSIVVDHFNYDTLSAAERHDVLLLQRPGQLRPDTKSYFDGEGVLALPRAAPHTLGDNILAAPILRAPVTAYSYNPKEEVAAVEDIWATGSQLSLISTLQTRSSSRFTLLGSVESLQDKWFTATVKAPGSGEETKTVNQEFAKQLTAWTFKETGVLKVGKIEHHLAQDDITAEDLNPTIYRVKNETVFSIEISEYSYDKFVPFEMPAEDALQLEFTMLSPFHRLKLEPAYRTENSTVFRTQFTVPDQHGIFSFRVNYKRPFLTTIEEKHEVTVRHFAHNEFPRSWKISGGWVWIAGLWSVIGGFMAFVAVWLYSEPASAQVKKNQ